MTDTRVTSLDVARRAGVSQSAVSRVFSGASASPQTAQKVRKAAAELGYRPNVLARAMVSGKSRIIGLVVAYLDNQFYPDVLERLSNALQAEGYHVLIFMASQKAGNIDNVVEEILDYQVDGIIAASVALSSDLSARCQAAGVPVVLFNRLQDDPRVSAVTSDNFEGGRKVGEFLIAGGHRSFGYIAGWEGASTQRDREAGYRAALHAAGHDLKCRTMGNFGMDEARAAAQEMCRTDPPEGIFVANDHMAIAVLDALRHDLGLDVPGDVSVVGYDDVPMARWPSYQLTTIRQPAGAMVAATVKLLMAMVDAPDMAPEKITLNGPLILRGSARIPKGWKV